MKIIPMRDLKDTVKVEKLCQEENGPVFVTKNGYGKLVVMDINYYEKMIEKIYEANLINEGLKDIETGKVIDEKEAINFIKEKYGF